MGDMEEMEVEGPFPFRRRKLVQYRQVRHDTDTTKDESQFDRLVTD